MKKKRKTYFARFLATVSMIALAMTSVVMGATSYTDEEKNMEGYDPWPVPQLQSFTSFASVNSITNQDINSICIDSNGNYLMTGSILGDTTTLNLPEMPNAAYYSGAVVKAGLPNRNQSFVFKMVVGDDGSLSQDWIQSLYAEYVDPSTPNGTANSYVKYTAANFNDATQLADGSYAAAGYIKIGSSTSTTTLVEMTLRDLSGNEYPISINGSGGSPYLSFVMHILPNGTVDFVDFLYSQSAASSFNSIQPTEDGGFVAVGHDSGNGADYANLYTGINSSLAKAGGQIVKYAPANGGSQPFTRSLLEKVVSTSAVFYDVLPVSDGYIVSGTFSGTGLTSTADGVLHNTLADGGTGLLMKLDAQGKILWTYQGQASMYYRILKDTDGNYVVAGQNTSDIGVSPVMTKLSPAGQLINERVMHGSTVLQDDGYGGVIKLINKFYDIIPSGDGGYIFGGFCQSPFENEYAITQIGGLANTNSGTAFSFAVKTDASFNTESIFYIGKADLYGTNYNMLDSAENGFVCAGGTWRDSTGDFLNYDFGITNLTKNYRAGFAAAYSYDWDGDGIVNTRDYYALDSSRYLPPSDDPDYTIDLTAGIPDANKFSDSLTYDNIAGLSPVENIQLSFNGAVLIAPTAAFDTIFKGKSGALDFSYSLNNTVFDVGNNKLIQAFNLDMSFNGGAVTTFGTNVKVTIPVTGITDSGKAKLFYVDENGVLRLVQGTEFTSDSVTFVTGHFSTYVVAEGSDLLGNTTETTGTTGSTSTPGTGDSTSYLPVAIMGILSVSVLFALYISFRRNRSYN